MVKIPGTESGRNNAVARAVLPFVIVSFVTTAMIPFRSAIGLVSVTAFLLTAVIAGGLSSDLWVAVATSITSGFALNFFFMRPYGSIKIHATEDLVGFIAYNMVCIISVGLISSWKKSMQKVATAQGMAENESRRARRGEQRLTWLNQISHDIRTPLSTVRAVVEDMHEGVEYDAETRQELLEVASDEIDRLDRLVSNWLMFGSMDSRPPESMFTAVDVSEVVTDSVRRLGPVLRRHTVETACEPHIDQVDGNFAEMQHLVLNLVTNAARHTPPGGTIRITTSARDEVVSLIVDDSGPGFPVTSFEELLKPYVVGESAGSSGLGLAICAEVAKRHNGTIRLDRSPMAGGRVIVDLARRSRKRVTP